MNERIKITQIPVSGKYQGYLWWSNKPEPEVFQNDKTIGLPTTSNPFIVEGNLYDKTNQKSYSIRFVDGQHLVNCFDLDALDILVQNGEYDKIDKPYLPNQFPKNIKKLCFREYWIPVPDEFCGNMPVLKPTMTAFIGFNCKEDKL